MMPLAEWIAMHTLLSWALVLSIAGLCSDLAWQHNRRWHRRAAAEGREPAVMRWHAGLLLIVATSLLFAAIAFAVSASQPGALARFDTALAVSLHTHLPATILRVVAGITRLGGTAFIAPLAGLVTLTLIWRRYRPLAAVWVITMLGIMPITIALKGLFHRVRPLHNHGFVVEHSWSFPSGHAFGSTVFYGMLAYVLLRVLAQRFHRGVIAAAMLLIALIGLSRIVLQVHYFSDVMAGYASGAAWLLLCMSAAEYLHANARGSTSNARPGAGESPRE